MSYCVLLSIFRTYSSTQYINKLEVGEEMDRNSLKQELQTTLQSKLPELRNELGLSQETFADLIGKSRQAVSLFERGELNITWETCLGIVAVAVNRDSDVLMKLYGDDFRKKFQKVVRK